MKEVWKLRKFDEITQSTLIGVVKNTKAQSPEFEFRYLKMNNIKNDNGLNEESFAFVNATNDEVEKYSLKENDFLFNTRNSYELVGKTCLYKSDYKNPTLFNNNILRVTFKDYIIPQFAAYVFSTASILEDLEKMKSGTTSVVGIYYKSLKNLKIPIPPLSEQKQIVDILDQTFTAIDQAKANIEKNIKNAKELFQSKLNDIFSQKGNGWEEKSFKELSTRIGDGLHGTPNYDENGDYYFINGNNLNDGLIEIKENTKRINEKEFIKHKKELTQNTVLISINGTLGKVAFFNGEPVILGKSACYINFKKEVNKHYIKYLVKSSLFFRNMANESTGATIKNFSLKSMRNYKLYLPSLNEQELLVKNLMMFEKDIMRLENHYNKNIDNLEELKKSILQKAFAGKLTNKMVEV